MPVAPRTTLPAAGYDEADQSQHPAKHEETRAWFRDRHDRRSISRRGWRRRLNA